jgi:hypothetical protein
MAHNSMQCGAVQTPVAAALSGVNNYKRMQAGTFIMIAPPSCASACEVRIRATVLSHFVVLSAIHDGVGIDCDMTKCLLSHL